MTVIALSNRIFFQNVEYFVANAICVDRRKMQENKHGKRRILLFERHCRRKTDLKSLGFSRYYFLIINFTNGLLLFFVIEPTARAAHNTILKQISVVVKQLYRGYIILFKKRKDLICCGPPEIVVALADDLCAGEGIEKKEIRLGFFKCHCPGNIARNHHGVVVIDDRAPIFIQFFGVIFPLTCLSFRSWKDAGRRSRTATLIFSFLC